MTEEINYEKMCQKAGNFAKILCEYQVSFKHEINDCDDDVASYIDIDGRDKETITVFFKSNGYVGFEVKKK